MPIALGFFANVYSLIMYNLLLQKLKNGSLRQVQFFLEMAERLIKINLDIIVNVTRVKIK